MLINRSVPTTGLLAFHFSGHPHRLLDVTDVIKVNVIMNTITK